MPIANIQRSFLKRWITWFVVAIPVFLSASTSAQNAEYPEPRFPKFVLDPSSDELMEAAREAVRQTEGMSPLGRAERGQTVHVFLHYSQDMEVWGAIKEAWAERGVNAVGINGWDALGVPRDEYEVRARENVLTGKDGWKEYGIFDTAYFPFLTPEVRKELKQPLTMLSRYAHYGEYLDEHPEVEHVFAGPGGNYFFWNLFVGDKYADKFIGNWQYLNKTDLFIKQRSFPADVWKMIDEHIVKPLAIVEEGTFDDPQGTNLHWVLTHEQSRYWDKRCGLDSYFPSHLCVYPSPAHATWKQGTLRATSNHIGFYPVMTVQINENGRVTDVQGGGRAGDMFRMLVENPVLKAASFPSAPEPGYWFLTLDGLGTNPKAVRNMPKLVDGTISMSNLGERLRAGVQHFSFGVPNLYGPQPDDLEYAEQNGLPFAHTAHMHVYFGTLKWKLRDTGEWVTIMDKGRLTAFDDPEIRALASRYGDPDTLFKYDWVPAIPGINVPGSYEEDYAPDPWDWLLSVWEDIKSGSYQYYIEDYEM